MNNAIKIATLNLCLGLKNKKDTVKKLILENDIDILCLQETELEPDFPTKLLTFRGYGYESENNVYKSRCGMFVSDKISYIRRNDLEIANNHVIMIDLNDKLKTRIICIYRPFNPSNVTQKQFFDAQLEFIKQNTNHNTIVLGDFNLDHRKKHDINYSHKHYFSALNETFVPLNLHQIVSFDTWSRVVNNSLRFSILDHIYAKDVTRKTNLSSHTPPFGDHLLISFEIASSKMMKNEIRKRNWKTYSKEKLIENLSKVDWNIEFDDVQSFWNCFESKLVEIIDKLAPLELFSTPNANNSNPPPHIKNKINKRSRLLKKLNKNPATSIDTRQSIKTLNKEIKSFFYQAKSKTIRKSIIPGNSKTLWDAVNKAKDLNVDSIPETLYHNEIKVPKHEQAKAFADFFSDKVKTIISSETIAENVYNGKRLIYSDSTPFMSSINVLNCLKDIKIKNCEGFDSG